MPDNGSHRRSRPVRGILPGGYSEGMTGMTDSVKPHRNSRVLPERPTGNRRTWENGKKAEVLYRGTRPLRSPPAEYNRQRVQKGAPSVSHDEAGHGKRKTDCRADPGYKGELPSGRQSPWHARQHGVSDYSISPTCSIMVSQDMTSRLSQVPVRRENRKWGRRRKSRRN